MNNKPLASFIALIGLVFTTTAQDTTYLSGRFESTDPNDAKYYQVVSQREELTEKKVYTIYGDLYLLENYADQAMETPEGVWEEYHSNGKLQSRTHYKNGLREGLYTYFDFKETMRLEGSYTKDLSEGIWKSYHRNGQLKYEREYQDGILEGSALGYYFDGKKKFVGSYSNNLFTLAEAYQPNGERMTEGNSGHWVGYTDSLQLGVQRGNYTDGLKQGKWEILNPETGQIVARLTFEKGKLVGPVVVFGEDKQVISEEEIEDYVDKGGAEAYLNLDPYPLNMDSVKLSIGYPQIARDAGIEGQVVVREMIDKSGRPTDYRVLRLVHPILSKAVTNQIMDLKFRPAIQDGKPIKFWVNIPFNFKLIGSDFKLFKKKKRKKKKN